MFSYQYPRPAVTVDAIVLHQINEEWNILLIERGKEPYTGKWALPGGFVDMDELLESACIHELKEETGIKLQKMEQFKTFDAIYRDPRHRTLSVVYYAILDHQQEIKAGDDAQKAKWFPINQLPELAFDHSEIIQEFIFNI